MPKIEPGLVPIGSAAEKLGIVLTEVSPQCVTATMPVSGNTQPYGILNGGASALFAETIASVAAYFWAQKNEKVAVGTGVSLSHFHAVTEGEVTGNARALHLGRRTAVYQVDITAGSEEELVASGQVSCQIITPPENYFKPKMGSNPPAGQ